MEVCMKKLLPIILVAVLCLTVAFGALVGCNATKPVVGLIALHDENSTYDKNFIDAFKAACEEKGLKQGEYVIATNIPESEKAYQKAAELADAGCKAVFADSFGHGSHIVKAAKEFTDVQFCHATGTDAILNKDTLPNFHNAFASIYEARYLAGVAAGLKLQEMITNNTLPKTAKMEGENYIIGYVGAYTYAEVISGYTSFYLGVKSVVSNVVMKVQFTGSWYDQAKEKTAAENLISLGAAVISQHADSMGAPTACENAGVPNVCYNLSTAEACPNTYVIASRINWKPYFLMMLDYVLEGKAIPNDWTGTMETGSVEVMAIGKAAAAGTQAKLDEVKAKLANKTLNVFDVNSFTVTVVKEGDNAKNTAATVDENGHLTAYTVNVDGSDKNAVENGAFMESKIRSAPYFDVQIDGITLLNSAF